MVKKEGKLTKESVKELMKIKGEARGIHLKNDAEYVLMKTGKSGLGQVEKELKELGFPIEYENVRNLEFYPAGLRALSLLAIKQTFGWDDNEIREMCRFAARVSFVIKLYIKFFYSVKKVMEKAAKMWQEYWTIGDLKVKDYDEEKKYAILRVEGLDLHPVYCRCLEGYFKGVTEMVTKSKKVNCRETNCSFENLEKGHEFLIKY